jgi:hypothetical protein
MPNSQLQCCKTKIKNQKPKIRKIKIKSKKILFSKIAKCLHKSILSFEEEKKKIGSSHFTSPAAKKMYPR